MKHVHVIRYFQARYEDRLGEDERAIVDRHLEDCETCRRYFDKMTSLLEGIDPVRLPRLEPDPFLPARIRALAGDGHALVSGAGKRGPADRPSPRPRPAFGRLAATVMSIAVVSAAFIGGAVGDELSSRINEASRAEDDAITGAYYDAFSPAGIDSNWEYVIENENGENS